MMWLNPGMSGCLIVAHTTLTKMMMTILWRGPGSAASKMPGGDNWFAVKDKLEKLPGYEIMSATQKNEAEYAPLFAAALFFCSVKGIAVPIASTLAFAGQVMYYWPRWMLANPKTNSNNGFPFYVPGALMRYASLIMLSLAMHNALK